jgi:predicted amidohydrolase
MNICLIQTYPEAKRKNIEHLGWVIKQLKADLYVLPELFITGFDYIAQHGPAHAETIPSGLTCQQIHGFLKGRSSAVVCGLLEQEGQHYYNVAAVFGNGGVGRYRQKYLATTFKGQVLPIQPGDLQTITVTLGTEQWKMGFMICNDYRMADEFFAEYKKRGVNAVVLIADSPTRAWLTEFPHYCQQYGLPAIVCNAAGPNGGGSCVINSLGEFMQLNTPLGQRNQLLDTPMAATGVL